MIPTNASSTHANFVFSMLDALTKSGNLSVATSIPIAIARKRIALFSPNAEIARCIDALNEPVFAFAFSSRN